MARDLSCDEKSRNNMNNMVSSGGFCYTQVSPTSNNNLQTQFSTSHQIHGDFHNNNNNTNQEMFMDSNTNMWKSFNKPHDHHHHHHQFSESTSGDVIVGPWQESNNNNIRPFMVDDSSLRCVFPSEANDNNNSNDQRPIQGLSLTLSSNNPSSIGLQSFELRQTTTQMTNLLQQQQQQQQGQFIQMRNSKFLGPTQELLNEFCSLGTKLQSDSQKQKSHKSKLQWELDQDNTDNTNNNNNNGASSSKTHSLYSLEFMELQKRKSKLLSMLEEVERRYKKYCDQMKAVVSSFEAVAGPGAAAVYSALASKAMSRHFRCLKDGIVSQIAATRKAMGEKVDQGGPGVPGTTRGETPRLRVLDQTLRQQRAFQQMSLMETHPWRPQRGLPERSVSVLRAWLFEHFLHPYPSDVDKHILARQTGLSRSQVSNWFINARVRLWKPMVEEMYVEETKEAQLDNPNDLTGSSSDAVDILGSVDPTGRQTRPEHQNHNHHDQKPTADQLVRIDPECLSSIVTNPTTTTATTIERTAKTLAQTHPMQIQRSQNFSRYTESYNAMDLDFSTYPASALYSNETNQDFIASGVGGGGVSLTLGLQQHHNHHHQGVSLAFSPASQSSLFYPRSSSSDHLHHNHHHHHHNNSIEDQVPVVQYSLLDGDQGQNLPYRNLMGAQLLHDLA